MLHVDLALSKYQITFWCFAIVSVIIGFSHLHYSCDPIKESEIGEACGTCGREEKCVQSYTRKT